MLRRETTAAFVQTGSWLFARYRFRAGKLEASRALGRASHTRLMQRQLAAPVLVLADDEHRHAWWLFRDECYRDDDGLSELEVKALLLERESQKERRVRKAIALMEQRTMPSTGREAIPDEVKIFVWQRDAGCCVSCSAREQLEFDHVIPVALGGANTARNLQLLCVECNRRKGASLVPGTRVKEAVDRP